MKKIIFLFVLQQTLLIGQLNVFIGKTKVQIKDFWSTKISSIYFDESIEELFIIMEGNAGVPSFQAIFNEKGKCRSHQTSISFVDISIIQARLKKMGYHYDEETSKWLDPTKKICAKINHYGARDYYSLDFENITKEKTVPTKKTEEEIIAAKKELNKITDFAKSTFGEKANCSVITKKGNCQGYVCDENLYTINDGIKDIILISTYEDIFDDGRIMIPYEFLPTKGCNVAISWEKLFNGLKKVVEQYKMDSLNKSKKQHEKWPENEHLYQHE